MPIRAVSLDGTLNLDRITGMKKFISFDLRGALLLLWFLAFSQPIYATTLKAKPIKNYKSVRAQRQSMAV